VPHLIIRRDGHVEREANLSAPIRIGRDPENELVLEDPDRGVSRFHAEIRGEPSAYSIADLESRNGTWIDGERITTAVLAPGATITIGPYTVEFQLDSAETDLTPAAGSEYTVFAPVGGARENDPSFQALGRPPWPPAIQQPRIARQRQAMLFAGATVLVACLLGISAYRHYSQAPPRTLSSITAPDARVEADVARHLAEARRLFDAGNFAAARIEVEKVLAIDPTNSEAVALRDRLDALRANPKTPSATPR
jgi:predicted component of type VI protein secretion system